MEIQYENPITSIQSIVVVNNGPKPLKYRYKGRNPYYAREQTVKRFLYLYSGTTVYALWSV